MKRFWGIVGYVVFWPESFLILSQHINRFIDRCRKDYFLVTRFVFCVKMYVHTCWQRCVSALSVLPQPEAHGTCSLEKRWHSNLKNTTFLNYTDIIVFGNSCDSPRRPSPAVFLAQWLLWLSGIDVDSLHDIERRGLTCFLNLLCNFHFLPQQVGDVFLNGTFLKKSVIITVRARMFSILIFFNPSPIRHQWRPSRN